MVNPAPSPSQCLIQITEGATTPMGRPSSGKRNERERQRVKCVNEGYAQLRHHLPEEYLEKRLSKVETLRAAIKYISYLQSLLYPDKAETKNNPGKVSSLRATTSHHTDPIFRII